MCVESGMYFFFQPSDLLILQGLLYILAFLYISAATCFLLNRATQVGLFCPRAEPPSIIINAARKRVIPNPHCLGI
jgi:hypothetical protein